MRNESRVQFNKLRRRIAELNGVESAAETFAVEPSVQQRLEQRIQESSGFLNRINVIGVDEVKGEKIGAGAWGSHHCRAHRCVSQGSHTARSE